MWRHKVVLRIPELVFVELGTKPGASPVMSNFLHRKKKMHLLLAAVSYSKSCLAAVILASNSNSILTSNLLELWMRQKPDI